VLKHIPLLGREMSNFAAFVDTYGTASIVDGRYIKSLNKWCNKKMLDKRVFKIYRKIFLIKFLRTI
jgi:uncharacterized protein (DUF2336 family)